MRHADPEITRYANCWRFRPRPADIAERRLGSIAFAKVFPTAANTRGRTVTANGVPVPPNDHAQGADTIRRLLFALAGGYVIGLARQPPHILPVESPAIWALQTCVALHRFALSHPFLCASASIDHA